MAGINFEKLLDCTGREVLRALQENARLSFSELGRRVALSPPAVTERVRKLEETGVITGYHAHVGPEKIGYPITAFILLTTRADRYPRVIALVDDTPEMIECHHVSGGASFAIKVVASCVSHLETLIGQLSPFGETNTLIVLSSPVVKSVLDPSEPNKD